MKTIIAVVPLLVTCVSLAAAAAPEVVELERGPHHRTWGTVQEILTAEGIAYRTNATVIELQSGLHRWDPQQNGYVLSSPRIEPFQDGAVVRGLQYQVIFSPNLATPGAIDLQLLDGQRLTGHLLCLAYTEGARSVMIAEVKDCAGLIGGPEDNVLTFANAFTDYNISVQYRVERGCFSQSLILHERLKPPTDYGLSDDAHLELLTEWSAAPQPVRETRVVEPAFNAQHALTDERISLGAMEFLTGKAFLLDQEEEGLLVFKSWEQVRDEAGNVRTFLYEKIPWRQIQPELQKLPPAQAKAGAQGKKQEQLAAALPPSPPNGERAGGENAADTSKAPSPRPTLSVPSGSGEGIAAASSPPQVQGVILPRSAAFLPSPRAKRPALKPIQMASLNPQPSPLNAPKAFVLDFELAVTTNNHTWRADFTYYVSGAVTVTTNLFMGGCVIKFAPTNSAKLTVTGPLTCQSTNYRPIILTARDDHTVGEAIGAGSLSGYYALYGIYLDNAGITYKLNNFHIRSAQTGIYFNTGTDNILSHSQLIGCSNGVGNAGSFILRNVLGQSCYYMMKGTGTAKAENTTFNSASALYSGYSLVWFTNCILANITSVGGYGGANNAQESSSSGVFQTVGAAQNYLASGSTNRNSGTININPSLLADLKKLTTYPPLVFSNTIISVPTTLNPQAQRDTDIPDRGYHYSPIDYAADLLIVTNTTLTLTNGVVLATFGDTSLWLRDNSQLFSEGTPINRNHICRYTAVQEQPLNWGNGSVFSHINLSPNYVASSPSARLRFTDFDEQASGGYHIFGADSVFTWNTLTLRDCAFNSGKLDISSPSPAILALTNNLFEALPVSMVYDPTVYCFNNHFQGGDHAFINTGSSTWTFRNNLFDRCTINATDTTNSHNAYINMTNLTHRLTPTNNTEVILSNLAYQSGPLGRYYQPTASTLLGVGSTNANLLSLYHFTCTTNQVKETNSMVDIGVHFVVLDGTGQPNDADADGWWDFFEDLNGNGLVNSWETSWTNATDLGLRVLITNPKNNSPIP